MSGTLEQRVAALEQLLAAMPGSEALNPNYLTVSPTGVVGAKFSGVVQAQGVTLPTYIGGIAPQPPNLIEWTEGGTTAGFADAVLQTSRQVQGHPPFGTFTGLSLTAYAPTGLANGQSLAAIAAVDGSGAQVARIQAEADIASSASTGKAIAQAGTHTATIIDSTGVSSFLQTPQQTDITVGSIGPGGNFTWNIGFTPGPTAGWDVSPVCVIDTANLSGFAWNAHVTGSTLSLTVGNPNAGAASGTLQVTIYTW